MDNEKKHIFKSYKNEQEEIESIEKIKDEKDHSVNSSISGYKDEKDHSVNSSISGYNVENKHSEKYPTNAFSPGKLDMGEPAFKDHEDNLKENPGVETDKKSDIDRPLPERAMHNRVR